MKREIFLVLLISLAIALSGCAQPQAETVYMYVCSDGTIVESPGLCRQEPEPNFEELCTSYCETLNPEDETSAEFIQAEIDNANYCDTNNDCALAIRKCPFGCHIFVNKDEVDRINELINGYRQSCILSCTPLGEYDCVEGKCVQIIKQA